MIVARKVREEQPDGAEAIRLSMVEGAVYRFRGLEGRSGERVGWVVPPGDYRLVGCGRHVHTGQELVIYRCLANGKMFVCTLADWAANFEAPALPLPVTMAPVIERRAGTPGMALPPNQGGER